MSLFQCQVPLAGLPVNLVLLSNGTLAFVRVAEFVGIYDQRAFGQDVDAMFGRDDFAFIHDEGYDEFAYNTAYNYKEIPSMLKWLQQQNLEEPNVRFEL